MKYLSTQRADKALTRAERLRDAAEECKVEAEAHYEFCFSSEVARQLEICEGKGPLKLAEYLVKVAREVEGSDLEKSWSTLKRARRIFRRAQSRVDRIKRIYYDSKSWRG